MPRHWADIICEIQKKGATLSSIAKQEGVSPSLVTDVIRGNSTSHKVAYAISALINIPTEKLWPGKYHESPAEYKKLRGVSKRGRLPANEPTPQLQEAS